MTQKRDIDPLNLSILADPRPEVLPVAPRASQAHTTRWRRTRRAGGRGGVGAQSECARAPRDATT